MPIHPSELSLVVRALQPLLGARAGGVFQVQRDRLYLELGDVLLLAVARGPFARLHPVHGREASPRQPFSFQGVLRRRLVAGLDRVAQVEGDRVVELGFGPLTLHLRLFERGGGVYLLEDGEVIASLHGPAPRVLPALVPSPAGSASPRVEGEGMRAALALGALLADQERAALADAARAVEARRLRAELSRRARLVQNLEGDLAACEAAPALRAAADALAASLHLVAPGAQRLVLPDLLDPTVLHEVALVPGKPPAVALNRAYRRAGTLDRRRLYAAARLSAVKEELAALQRALDGLGEAWPSAPPPPAPRRAAPPAHPGVERWVGPDAQEVWVGRSAAANRLLTFRLARSRDWWMHLRDVPGAHVLIRRPDGNPPPLELLLVAAQLAARQGRVAEGAVVEVQYARIGDVRSVKGAPDGRVLVHRERVLSVRSDAARLDGWSRLADRATAPT